MTDKKHFLIYCTVITILLLEFCFLQGYVGSRRYIPFFLFEVVVLLFVSMARRSLLLRVLLIFPIFIEAIQYASIYSTGHYIVPLTFLNMGNAHVIGKQAYTVTAIILIYIILFYVNIFLLGKIDIYSKIRAFLAVITYIIVMIAMFFIYNTKITRVTYPFPIENISYVTYQTLKVLFAQQTDKHAKIFERNSIDSNFKNKITSISYRDYNIVVIFLEGTSTAVLSEGLTPRLWALQKRGLNIINYYNHTAATFRGLRGQLISGYCLKGGREYNDEKAWAPLLARMLTDNTGLVPSIESVPSILEAHGYTTVFISPHNQHDRLAHVMKRVGFQQVLTAENYEAPSGPSRPFLTDKQSYQFLWEELGKLDSLKKPFFLCMYQLGTHHGLDSPDKKFGDGKNAYLNKFHNADFWLGNFMDRYLSSSVSDKTILIITADHSTFPTPEYRKTFNTKAQYFVDEIPFLILIKGLPEMTIDAGYKNTLSFAPTLLDILGIDKVDTHFLGDSLFSDKPGNMFSHISCIEDLCFHTGKDGVRFIEKGKFTEVRDLIDKYCSFGG